MGGPSPVEVGRGERTYNRPAMHVTSTPAPKSSVLLEIELPPERLDQSVDEAVRRLARRTKVAGFRPGKAPRFMLERVLGPGAVLDEAVDLLLESAYRDAVLEQGLVPLAQASIDVVQAEPGKPFKFTATVQVPPEVTLGDYANFNFTPEIETVDDAKVTTVIDELRDQNASLRPVEDRPAQTGDYAVIGFVGTRDGVPFEGGSSERMPLILGEERLIPGFEDHLVGLEVGGSTEFDIVFPEDYGEATLAGQTAHFAVDLKELREKVLPDLDDDFARSMGDFADVAALRVEIQHRLERNALDRARHGFADRIIDYAVANATVELPDILVDQEVEVLHDEFRSSLARQGIAEQAYLKATEADRGGPPRRVPAARRGPRQDPARAVQDRRGRGDRGHRRGRRGRDRHGPPALRRGPADDRLLRVRARAELHPEHAPPDADGRDARRSLAGRPSRPSGAAPLRGGGAGRGRDRVDGRRGGHRCHRPVDRPRSRGPDAGLETDDQAAAGPISDEPAAPAASQEASPAADPA